MGVGAAVAAVPHLSSTKICKKESTSDNGNEDSFIRYSDRFYSDSHMAYDK